jgi:hypothetical protein
MVGYVPRPSPKAYLFVDSPHPLVEKAALDLILLRILAFDFEDQVVT